jgi:AcrR family transcriptional regulator
VAEVAEAAEVSRRTVYMYFPTLEQLFIDATLEIVAGKTMEGAISDEDFGGDVEARVERMARAAQQMAAATERQGRALMRLTADPRVDRNPGGPPPRGYRRVEWIEQALAPLRSRLDAPRFERLVSALAMIVGWEALIVQRDIRALSLQDAENVSAWAARALVKATLDELRQAKRSRGASRSRRTSTRARRTAPAI